MSTMLLDMNKDEATVADNVVRYKRAEIEEQYPTLLKQYQEDQKRLAELKKEVEDLEARVKSSESVVELYGALINAFDQNFPKIPVEDKTVPDAPERTPEEKPDVSFTDTANAPTEEVTDTPVNETPDLHEGVLPQEH